MIIGAGIRIGGGISMIVPPIPPLAPIVSRSTTRSYVHFITPEGTLAGTCDIGTNTALAGAQYYRYGDYMYVFQNYGGTAWSKIDLRTFTVASTGTLGSNMGRGQFSPISDSQLLRVSSADTKYYIFDMATGVETAYTYTAGDNTAIAQTHATLTFFDKTSTGVANVSDQIYWTSANGVSFNSEINYATLTGTSLSAKTDLTGTTNYSRNYALSIDNDRGLLWLFDSSLRRIVHAGATVTQISLSNFTSGGKTYTPVAPQSYDAAGAGGAGVTGNVYGTWRNNTSGVYTWKFCLYDPLGSATPTATELLTYPAGGYYAYNHPEYVIMPLNESGHVLFAYFDITDNTETIKVVVFDGSTQIGSTQTITISNTYTGNTANTSTRGGPGTQSYLGPVLA